MVFIFFYGKWFIEDKILKAVESYNKVTHTQKKQVTYFTIALSKNALFFKTFWSSSNILEKLKERLHVFPSSTDICNVDSGWNFSVLQIPCLLFKPLSCPLWSVPLEGWCLWTASMGSLALCLNLSPPVGITLRRLQSERREWSELHVDRFHLPKPQLCRMLSPKATVFIFWLLLPHFSSSGLGVIITSLYCLEVCLTVLLVALNSANNFVINCLFP